MIRPDPEPEWYEEAIAGERPPLTQKSRTWRLVFAAIGCFWLGVGAALWWLL